MKKKHTLPHLHFLLIGLGSIGRRHLNNLIKNEEKFISVVTSQSKTEQNVTFYKNLSDVDKEPNYFVIICTPTHLHYQDVKLVTEQLNLSGIYLEKPISHKINDAIKIKHIAKKFNLPIQIGHDLRFDPGLLLLSKIIKTCVYGKVLFFNCEVGQYLPSWRKNQHYESSYSSEERKGGGVMLDLIHEYDYLLWLFGPVAYVFCDKNHVSNLNINCEDLSLNILKFKNEVQGILSLDYIQKRYSRRLKVVFEKTEVIWEYGKPHLLTSNGLKKIGPLTKDQRLNQCLYSFVNDLHNKTDNLEESINSLNLVEKAKISSTFKIPIYL